MSQPMPISPQFLLDKSKGEEIPPARLMTSSERRAGTFRKEQRETLDLSGVAFTLSKDGLDPDDYQYVFDPA